jgi:hypothetical protein
MSFDINTVEEIHVKFSLESQLPPVIYKGKGLEKFRRLVLSSPQYGAVNQPVVVDEDSSDRSSEDSSLELPKKSKSKKLTKPPKTKHASHASHTNRPSANGYTHANLSYAPADIIASKGKSAVDLGREMQRQAESAMNMKF